MPEYIDREAANLALAEQGFDWDKVKQALASVPTIHIPEVRNSDPLKSCPFCGETPTIKRISHGYNRDNFTASYKIGCPKCDIEFIRNSTYTLENGIAYTLKDGYGELIAIWNSRVTYEGE